MAGATLDGIWNLVLVCKKCNRVEKSAKIPALPFLERLHSRNNFFIDSHHPLRETLMEQTGRTEPTRAVFLQTIYNESKESLTGNWKPEDEHEAAL